MQGVHDTGMRAVFGGARHCGCREIGTDRLSIAATSKLDPGPEQRHMPEHPLAIGLAPHHQPSVAPGSEWRRLNGADELGPELISHSVEVGARSLYEAGALALAEFRSSGVIEHIGPAIRFQIEFAVRPPTTRSPFHGSKPGLHPARRV